MFALGRSGASRNPSDTVKADFAADRTLASVAALPKPRRFGSQTHGPPREDERIAN
jgi:hypothetical protein